ncbi:hypothetical protein KKC1_33180 [Calderihabitans maritimus]|uniref:Uncharacterized protein n=1 Tax=Calderihabitans maritimus TaxID=1246530 RepID=A0A1Z5HXE8_9FIRM|nr:hypothetical protein KKC1_33180 [Calderihabitans maritimus]
MAWEGFNVITFNTGVLPGAQDITGSFDPATSSQNLLAAKLCKRCR